MTEVAIVDASAMVDLLIGSSAGVRVSARLRGHELHVPAHFDAEVLSALGRLQRAGHIGVDRVAAALERLVAAPLERDPLGPLLDGAWGRRHNLRLVDALYAELAHQLGAIIVTTDSRLAAASNSAELVPRQP